MKIKPTLACGVFQRIASVVLLALGLVAGHRAAAQVVTFPDSNLENAVRNALQIYSPTNIQQSDMLALTNLYTPFASIHDLTGLNTASNLIALDLGFNNITDATPIAGLTQLTELHLGWNPMTDCSSLAPLTGLTYLDLNSSQLTNIAPLAGLTNLVKFIVPWNHIVDASAVAGMKNLNYLDIGGNRFGAQDASITNVPGLGNLKNLQWLSLYYLRMADLAPLASLTLLTNLEIGFNPSPSNYSVLNGLTNLQYLHFTSDGISNMSFVSNMPYLTDIDCGYNPITDLSPTLGRDLTSLQAYYDGPLTNFALVVTFPHLTRLSLGGEALSNLSFLSGLTNLQELWIDGNTNIPSIAPILSLTNLWHLDVDGDNFPDLAALAALTNLTDLEMNGFITPPNLAFLGSMGNLNTLDLGNDHVGSLVALTNLTNLNNLYLDPDFLTDIGPLLTFPRLGYVDLRNNLIDTNVDSPAYNVITNLQSNYVNVDFNPQSIAPAVIVWDSPADACVAVGDIAYFGASASSTNNTVTYQWQFNGGDLPGETNDYLWLTNVGSNQAGEYRAVMTDGNGYAATDAGHLYVGDTNCGRTITIVQQPVAAVAGVGEDVQFSVVATTTLTNLYYQWLFNGTNIAGLDFDGDISPVLNVYGVDFSAAGTYQVLVTDDSSNTVASAVVQLAVVDEIPFTDPNLKSQIISSLNLPPDSTIHLTDLDNLYYISLNYVTPPITNLSGLQYARNLQSLDLSGNFISDPSPLAGLTQLRSLYLSGCGLEDASFVSYLVNLYDLNLDNNTIHSVPDMSGLAENLNYLSINENGPLIYYYRVGVLTNLYQLSLHEDFIGDVNFAAGMMQLQSLDVGGDYFQDPNADYVSDISPLIGKTQLNWLSLSWDQVTNVPIIAEFTNLGNLYLNSNHFSSIDFISNFPALHDFSVNFTGVTNLAPLAGHTPMTWLDVSYIAASDLSYVAGLTNLGTLYAGGNNAGTANFVTALTNVGWLSLERNGITDLTPLVGLSNLYYCVLENNLLTDASVLAPKTNLNYLYLTGNQIHDLSPLSGLTNLQSLTLDGNGFTNIAPIASLTNLSSLYMQSNAVQDVTPLAGLTNLYWGLDVSANQISDFSPLTNLHILTWLGPWQNNATVLPSLVSLTNITSLDFWGNKLTNAAGVSGMTKLNWLGLSRNNFTTIQTLTGLPNLGTLELYSNNLVDVSGISGLTSLTWLPLGGNALQDIHAVTLLIHLYYVDVRNNWLNTNAGSPVMSDIAILQGHNTYVDYVPQNTLALMSPAVAGVNQIKFTVLSPGSNTVQIQRSTDLKFWNTIGVITNTTGSDLFKDTNATGAKLFYRATR